MSKFPAFQFYPKDCFTDETVAAMDDREFGFYMRCLGHAWLNDGIPVDLDRLARVMARTREYLDSVWPAVSPCWQSDPARPQRLVNPRQEKQRSEYISLSQSRKGAAEARWGKRPKSNPPVMQLHMQGKSKPVQVECSPVSCLQTASSTPPETDEADLPPESRWAGRSRAEILSLLLEGSRLYACADLEASAFENHTDAELAELLDHLHENFVTPLPIPTRAGVAAELLAGAGLSLADYEALEVAA